MTAEVRTINDILTRHLEALDGVQQLFGRCGANDTEPDSEIARALRDALCEGSFGTLPTTPEAWALFPEMPSAQKAATMLWQATRASCDVLQMMTKSEREAVAADPDHKIHRWLWRVTTQMPLEVKR